MADQEHGFALFLIDPAGPGSSSPMRAADKKNLGKGALHWLQQVRSSAPNSLVVPSKNGPTCFNTMQHGHEVL
ncbi:hypothetical protein Q3C01_12865 [Bradyrhizobium sp. UFLA05-109]